MFARSHFAVGASGDSDDRTTVFALVLAFAVALALAGVAAGVVRRRSPRLEPPF